MQDEQGGHLSALLVFVATARQHTLRCLALTFGEPG